MRRAWPTTVLLATVLGLFLGMGSFAQDADRSANEASPYSPPTFSFNEEGIVALEAVRLTLAHDPNLLLQEEDVNLQRGFGQELRGAFDWVFAGEASYQHDRKELRRSVLDGQREKREDLAVVQETSCTRQEKEAATIAELEAAIAATPGFSPPIESDPSIDTKVVLLDTLIRALDDPDKVNIVTAERDLLLQAELEAATANEFVAGTQCKESAEDLARIGDTPENEEFDSATLNLGLDKSFRTGLGLHTYIDGRYDSTQFVGKSNGYFEVREDPNNPGQDWVIDGFPITRFIDYGGKNIEDVYEIDVGFDLNMPLLRGRGRDSAAANETAALIDLEASELILEHGASQSILTTLVSYWNLLAAQERIAILEEAVRLQEELVKLASDLIEADEMPRSEIARVKASEAGARSQVDSAKRDLVSARMALARAMGLNVIEQANAPLAAGPFPSTPPEEAITALVSRDLGNQAVGRRADVEASRSLIRSGKVLARAAQIDLRSRLDLAVGLWTTAVGESSLSDAVDTWYGPSWSLALFFEKPIGNNQREGRLVQRDTQVRQRYISAADLERNVRLSVVRVLNSLAEARKQLVRAEEAAGYFQKTIETEFELLRYGDSTLIDAILTQQQSTSSQLAVLSARQQVATLMAQLRFETATFLQRGDEGRTVNEERLTTLPGEESGS